MTNKDELGLGELVPALREGSEAATWTEALKLCARAADALTTLIAERDGLREALEPFAEAAENLDPNHTDGSPIWETPAAMCIDAKHLRRAKELVDAR